MAVSERDRAFLRRLGEIKAASHAAQDARHGAVSLDERLRRSWALYERLRACAVQRDDRDDPSPFYKRARALGLYRP